MIRCIHDVHIDKACEQCQEIYGEWRTRTIEVLLPKPPKFIRIDLPALTSDRKQRDE